MAELPEVKLVPLTLHNWETVLNLKPRPEQQEFLPDILHSIALSRFDGSELLGIEHNQLMVGYLQWAKWSGVYWITRILVDRSYQGLGLGKAALIQLLDQLATYKNAYEVRTTVAIKNGMAEYLFFAQGFERTMELENREVVLKLDLDGYRKRRQRERSL